MNGAKGVKCRGTVGKIVASRIRKNTPSFAVRAKRKPKKEREQEEFQEKESTKLSAGRPQFKASQILFVTVSLLCFNCKSSNVVLISLQCSFLIFTGSILRPRIITVFYPEVVCEGLMCCIMYIMFLFCIDTSTSSENEPIRHV